MAYSSELEDMLNQGFRYALSLTGDEDEAYDLVQSGYLKILEKNKPLVVSYLIRIIRNAHVDKKRREKYRMRWAVRTKADKSYEQELGGEPYLEKVLAEFPERNREIMFLAIVQEYTAQEIADLIGLPRGTVLSILHRTKNRLREKMQEGRETL